MSTLRLTLTVAALVAATFPAVTAATDRQGEYQALKIWCIERTKWTQEGRTHAMTLATPDYYFHFHHYCAALNHMNSAYSAKNKEARRYELERVIGETGYVLSHVPADHPLLPPLYTLRGQAQTLGHKHAAAESELRQALAMDPDHLEAIAILAQLYIDTKRQDNAVKLIRHGLEVSPGNKAMRRLGTQLKIDLPPEEAKPVPAVEPPVKPPATPEQAPTAVPPAPVDTAPAGPPDIGTASNPWCRFCPDVPSSPPQATPSMPGVVPKAGR